MLNKAEKYHYPLYSVLLLYAIELITSTTILHMVFRCILRFQVHEVSRIEM